MQTKMVNVDSRRIDESRLQQPFPIAEVEKERYHLFSESLEAAVLPHMFLSALVAYSREGFFVRGQAPYQIPSIAFPFLQELVSIFFPDSWRIFFVPSDIERNNRTQYIFRHQNNTRWFKQFREVLPHLYKLLEDSDALDTSAHIHTHEEVKKHQFSRITPQSFRNKHLRNDRLVGCKRK